MKTHEPDYQRSYTSTKPRKPRKDKGTIRRDLARLLSGYWSDDEDGQAEVWEDEDCEEDSDMEVQLDNPHSTNTEKDSGSREIQMDEDVQ